MKKLNILHIINGMTVGGAEILLANSLAEGGLQEKCENSLIYLNGSSHLLDRIDKRIKVYCLNYTGFLKLPAVLLKIRKIVKENKFDIIHSHLTPVGSYARFAIPDTVPLVHTLHTMYTRDTSTRKIFMQLDKKILFRHRKTSLIFLSELLRQDFLGAVPFKGKTFTLTNFIEDKYFDNAAIKEHHTQFKVVAVGAFRSEKNYAYLLKIAEDFKAGNIQIDIYGSGDAEQFKQLIEEKKLPVVIQGQHNNISAVLPNYDLFIMTSSFEGYPLSVIEAMASGLPCFLSNIPTLKDIGNNKAVFFELDNAEAAANELKALSGNKVLLKQLSERGKAFANTECRRDNYTSKLMGIYQNILN